MSELSSSRALGSVCALGLHKCPGSPLQKVASSVAISCPSPTSLSESLTSFPSHGESFGSLSPTVLRSSSFSPPTFTGAIVTMSPSSRSPERPQVSTPAVLGTPTFVSLRIPYLHEMSPPATSSSHNVSISGISSHRRPSTPQIASPPRVLVSARESLERSHSSLPCQDSSQDLVAWRSARDLKSRGPTVDIRPSTRSQSCAPGSSTSLTRRSSTTRSSSLGSASIRASEARPVTSRPSSKIATDTTEKSSKRTPASRTRSSSNKSQPSGVAMRQRSQTRQFPVTPTARRPAPAPRRKRQPSSGPRRASTVCPVPTQRRDSASPALRRPLPGGASPGQCRSTSRRPSPPKPLLARSSSSRRASPVRASVQPLKSFQPSSTSNPKTLTRQKSPMKSHFVPRPSPSYSKVPTCVSIPGRSQMSGSARATPSPTPTFVNKPPSLTGLLPRSHISQHSLHGFRHFSAEERSSTPNSQRSWSPADSVHSRCESTIPGSVSSGMSEVEYGFHSADIREVVSGVNKENALLTADIERTRAELAAMTDACKRAQVQTECAIGTIDEMSEEVDCLRKAKESAESELDQLKAHLEAVSASLRDKQSQTDCKSQSELEPELQERVQQLALLQTQAARAEVVKLRQIILDGQKRLSECESRCLEWKNRARAEEAARKQTEKERDIIKSHASTLNSKWQAAKEHMQQDSQHISELRHRISMLADQHAQMGKDLTLTRAHLKQLQVEVEVRDEREVYKIVRGAPPRWVSEARADLQAEEILYRTYVEAEQASCWQLLSVSLLGLIWPSLESSKKSSTPAHTDLFAVSAQKHNFQPWDPFYGPCHESRIEHCTATLD